jgi:hypothetical protein
MASKIPLSNDIGDRDTDLIDLHWSEMSLVAVVKMNPWLKHGFLYSWPIFTFAAVRESKIKLATPWWVFLNAS